MKEVNRRRELEGIAFRTWGTISLALNLSEGEEPVETRAGEPRLHKPHRHHIIQHGPIRLFISAVDKGLSAIR